MKSHETDFMTSAVKDTVGIKEAVVVMAEIKLMKTKKHQGAVSEMDYLTSFP